MQTETPETPIRTPLEDQLVREATAMASYALASGHQVPVAVVQILQDAQLASDSRSDSGVDVPALSWAHSELTRLVAPAAPRAVLLLADQRSSRDRWSIFGPIRLVRYLLALALVSVLGVLLIGASDQVSPTTASVLSLTGVPSLLNSMFLLCAASVGAAFSGLFRINLYIAATTYDPKHDASYWVQYGLGVIAGVLLATLIPVAETTGTPITRPVLALVGGFSASLLYRIMDRLSRSIESMVSGPADSAAGGQASSYPAIPGYSGAPAPTTDELVIALSRLTTALGQPQNVPNGPPVIAEPREKQLAAGTVRPGDAVGERATP